ncbi:hypothetical protein M378DRAFT_277542 [Amanita muscaria Koide BX008]|uniref:Uncharacterized protein n=1 Tax=Amanita muscaria (strain Koide BX008) TaxID=946122 RepID=A0A0C2WS09_AMAMK|nr:hypothetical protein M378DRAFT_277542 [Amanita muscaria Koide BX008]
MVKGLPFPYTRKAQFERSMECPLGTGWDTPWILKVNVTIKVCCHSLHISLDIDTISVLPITDFTPITYS